jgi:hypothetical protein
VIGASVIPKEIVMLDSLPASLRHLVFAVAPILLGWAASEVVPFVQGKNPLAAYLLGSLITAALAYFTPATRQYGVGSASR